METKKIKAFRNQRCQECGRPIDEMYVVSPKCVKDKEWKLCGKCYNKLGGK